MLHVGVIARNNDELNDLMLYIESQEKEINTRLLRSRNSKFMSTDNVEYYGIIIKNSNGFCGNRLDQILKPIGLDIEGNLYLMPLIATSCVPKEFQIQEINA